MAHSACPQCGIVILASEGRYRRRGQDLHIACYDAWAASERARGQARADGDTASALAHVAPSSEGADAIPWQPTWNQTLAPGNAAYPAPSTRSALAEMVKIVAAASLVVGSAFWLGAM